MRDCGIFSGMDDHRSRVFTLSQANALLPQIEAWIVHFLNQKEVHARRHDTLFMEELLVQKETKNGSGGFSGCAVDQEAMELENFLGELEKCADEIRALGGVIRNIEMGWIDFPARLDGEIIYFCWRRGEKTIQYYHLPSDVTERRPLAV